MEIVLVMLSKLGVCRRIGLVELLLPLVWVG